MSSSHLALFIDEFAAVGVVEVVPGKVLAALCGLYAKAASRQVTTGPQLVDGSWPWCGPSASLISPRRHFCCTLVSRISAAIALFRFSGRRGLASLFARSGSRRLE